jgi:hypothetical protein
MLKNFICGNCQKDEEAKSPQANEQLKLLVKPMANDDAL